MLDEWGLQSLAWADVELSEQTPARLVVESKRLAAKALRIFSILSSPKDLRSARMIIKAMITSLKGSQLRWKDSREKYAQKNIRLLKNCLCFKQIFERGCRSFCCHSWITCIYDSCSKIKSIRRRKTRRGGR